MSKRGRLGKVEQEQILSLYGTMPAADIAAKLNRTVETVQEYAKLHVKNPEVVKPADIEQVVIREELRQSEAWKNLKLEFVPDELKYFEESYIKLMSQFKGDVLASEETQIFQTIKFEILMSRNLKERRRAREDIIRLEKIQRDFLQQYGGTPTGMTEDDRDFALNLETQLNAARQAEQSRTTEYTKLQERHNSLMHALKGVRDQRVKQVENSKVSFISVIKMLQDRDVQEREGRQLELMKMAGKKEYERLGRPMVYDDGNEDSPILSADTVDLGPEEDEDADA